MLRADVVVLERARLVLCENDDLAGTLGEALEHAPQPQMNRAIRRPRASNDAPTSSSRYCTENARLSIGGASAVDAL